MNNRNFAPAFDAMLVFAAAGLVSVAILTAQESGLANAKPLQGEIGTWKLNVEKSKYHPGPSQQSGVSTRELTPEGVKVSTKAVDGEGKATDVENVSIYDGKDHVLNGNAVADTAARTRVDDFMVATILKKAGKVVQTNTFVISADGTVITITTEGTDAESRPINDVVVWEKQ